MTSHPSPQLISIFESTVDHYPNHEAIICDNLSFTYAELDQKANQIAHYLLSQHIQSGDIVGVLLPRSLDCYVAMLALYKIGAVYVPIAEEYPGERINHILDDMPFALLITSEALIAHRNIHCPKTALLQNILPKINQQSTARLPPPKTITPNDPTCYVIYTSGSTGKPNGVEIGHHSICHYIKVASTTYGITNDDRVYHGFSLAFYASFEEIWMAFANGATLIVATSKDVRSGLGLIEFLNQHQITVFSTVPTLLSSLQGDVKSLRLLILGGEVCTPKILTPWVRAGLKIMNTYGPTEATVVTTVAEYSQDCPITIGKPLPGYEVLILNEQLQPVEPGEEGELCIAGPGLAKGYINRETITAAKFIPNPLAPDKRLYRTGDLAQWNEHDELLFLGRLDDQIKLRGFRLELNEIETVLMTDPNIKQAVVALLFPEDPKLVVYYTTASSKKVDIKTLKDLLSQHLPAFMLPNIYEPLKQFPLLPSGKVNRKQLPPPKSKPQANPYHAPKTALEKIISTIVTTVLKAPKISINDDFFYDLGVHSLTGAAIISQLRKHPECQHLSILDLYQHRTIQSLANACTQEHPHATTHTHKFKRTSVWRYRLSAVGQAFGVLFTYALTSWQVLAFFAAYVWISARYPLVSFASAKIFLGLVIAVPLCSLTIIIALKWLLLGRVKPGKHRLWSWFYWRWWFINRLENTLFPSAHFVGTPLMTLYYRMMGAHIGQDCAINTAHMGMHDLITIGDRSTINADAVLKAYFIEEGYLHLGPITLGTDCYVGIHAILSIHTTMASQSALDDLSMVPSHHTLKTQQFYCGSPAKATACPEHHIFQQASNHAPLSTLCKFAIGSLHCAAMILVEIIHYGLYAPPLYWLFSIYAHHTIFYTLCALPLATFMYFTLLCSTIILFKKISRPVKPGRMALQTLTWLKYWVLSKLLELPETLAMADSLYYPVFLRFLGAKLGTDVEMSEISHLAPDMLSIHDHGFVAAYASIAAPKMYHNQLFFDHATVGNASFVGNRGILPQGAYLHDGSLIACLSVMPNDQEQAAMKHSTWLGCPPILLPNRELSQIDPSAKYAQPTPRLKAWRWIVEFLRIQIPASLTLCRLSVLCFLCLSSIKISTVALLFPVAEAGFMLTLVAGFAVLKWSLIGRYKPDIIPLWHPFIRRKDIVEYTYGYFLNTHIIAVIVGTPFLPGLLRLLGTKVGRYAYIETGSFEEFDLIHIEDEVEINSNAVLQTHLYEDRIFKMSHLHIQSRCNIGRDSIVLYDTVMKSHATLGSLSLLMKGETLPTNSVWAGCPAQVVEE
ncbi:MAG: amino acid adenylation domain-containing protein [Gammaproteobacteria bacterium]|nr:amino acid adenylation domain-containing protein [Gammaproteobacteria bacterium]